MNRIIKVALYIVLLTAALWLGVRFASAYHELMRKAPERIQLDQDMTPSEGTNAPAGTPVGGTNAPTLTIETNEPGETLTNAVSVTNRVATNVQAVASAKQRKAERQRLLREKLTQPENVSATTLMGYGATLLFVVAGLSLLIANDFSHFFADRFHAFIIDESGPAAKDPEYERAEQKWADGQHLEAIQLMRDYLKQHPREQYVAIRIAEIYEKDLGNFLAAALEYEEILKHHLPPEQWGWAAIHLANLYTGKLNKNEKAVALLKRIVNEYGQTPAAEKARARLEQIEGGKEPPPEEEPSSGMPRGFRPK